jgi:hypothetical protein
METKLMSSTLEIIRGLGQAAAGVYDGSHDERYSDNGDEYKAGLKREAGDPILDKRVMDGFSVRFYGNSMILSYQGEVSMKELKNEKYDQEVARMLNDIKKFLQKEYKRITGKSVRLSPKGEPSMMVQSTSRVRNWVQASQHYTISGMDSEPILEPSEDNVNDITRNFLDLASNKRPSNDTRGK